MKTWGWGLISFAAFLLIIFGIKSWQLIVLLFIIGLVMIIRGKEPPEDGDSKNDKGVK